MTNIVELLRNIGIDIPEEKSADVLKATHDGGYITRAEHEKAIGKVTTDRDQWKTRAETAETALNRFDGIDPDKIKDEIQSYKNQISEAEKSFKAQIEQRDFDDALKSYMDGVKFTSKVARSGIEAQIREKGLKLSDGVILGLSDYVSHLREADPGAFVNEAQETAEANKAQFTAPTGGTAAPTKTATTPPLIF